MGFNDYRARYADQSTYAVGDTAYWDNNQNWGSGISSGKVVKVTKTTLTTESGKVFRWQPSRKVMIDKCGWNDYNHHELITPSAAEARMERHNREEAEKAARNCIKVAAAKASEKWASLEDIQSAIEEMQVQLENLKVIKES